MPCPRKAPLPKALKYTVFGLFLCVAAIVAVALYAIKTVDFSVDMAGCAVDWSYASGPGSTCAE